MLKSCPEAQTNMPLNYINISFNFIIHISTKSSHICPNWWVGLVNIIATNLMIHCMVDIGLSMYIMASFCVIPALISLLKSLKLLNLSSLSPITKKIGMSIEASNWWSGYNIFILFFYLIFHWKIYCICKKILNEWARDCAYFIDCIFKIHLKWYMIMPFGVFSYNKTSCFCQDNRVSVESVTFLGI